MQLRDCAVAAPCSSRRATTPMSSCWRCAQKYPDSNEVRTEQQQLAFAFLERTRTALAAGDVETARAFLSRVDTLVPNMAATKSLQTQLAAAQQQRNFAANIVQAKTLKRVREVPPSYPREAERLGIKGWVDVEFTIAPDGTTQDVVVRNARAAAHVRPGGGRCSEALALRAGDARRRCGPAARRHADSLRAEVGPRARGSRRPDRLQVPGLRCLRSCVLPSRYASSAHTAATAAPTQRDARVSQLRATKSSACAERAGRIAGAIDRRVDEVLRLVLRLAVDAREQHLAARPHERVLADAPDDHDDEQHRQHREQRERAVAEHHQDRRQHDHVDSRIHFVKRLNANS